jgi:predicted MFS family arabinose efflux permease
LCSRRLGFVSLLLGAAGALLIGYVSSTYAILVVCMFVYSAGQHLFMPVASTIGMELAEEGKTGRRLGQLNAIRNFATILGSFFIFLGFKFFHFDYKITFTLAAIGLATAACLMFAMRPEKTKPPKMYLQLHKEYKLFYILNVLYGTRKQLFITFAPWVIVTIFQQPTQTLATLLTIGGVIGVLFQPLLGWAIDHLGERFVLVSEAALLAVVCLCYGFAKTFLPNGPAFILTCVCYLLDQMLMSVTMARSTYMKKIAVKPDDIQPALTTAVTIDHFFSMGIALIGGLIWNTFGYQYVFLMGVGIAALNFIAAMQVRIPAEATPTTMLQ